MRVANGKSCLQRATGEIIGNRSTEGIWSNREGQRMRSYPVVDHSGC